MTSDRTCVVRNANLARRTFYPIADRFDHKRWSIPVVYGACKVFSSGTMNE